MKHISICCLLCFLYACSGPDSGMHQTEIPKHDYSTDIDSLKIIFGIHAYQPVNAMWKVTNLVHKSGERITVPGPSDYVLEALIQFDRRSADQIKLDYATQFKTQGICAVKDYWFSWLPADMILKDKKDTSLVYDAAFFE
ncbi:MAG TPA: hypothetical protein VNZ86_00530, partial [Bacteroidia bacterium]|nr:hypothetical protein [Bacteroidia bacterium]